MKNKIQFLNTDSNSSYNANKKFITKTCKALDVKKKVLLNIFQDSNIMVCNDKIYKNNKVISELEFIDYILETKIYY